LYWGRSVAAPSAQASPEAIQSRPHWVGGS